VRQLQLKMSKRVLRLYPDPFAEVPLRGLYLDHHIHTLGRHGEPFVYANFLSSLDGRIAVEDGCTGASYIPWSLRGAPACARVAGKGL
jgi:hypothetical protein